MTEHMSTGLIPKPIEFMTVDYGQNGNRLPPMSSGQASSGKEKEFTALRQQQIELEQGKLNIDMQLMSKRNEFARRLKSGEDQLTVMQAFNNYLVNEYYPSQQRQNANEDLATRRLERAALFDKEVQARSAGTEPMLVKKGSYYDLLIDPTTNQVMRFGDYEPFLNRLGWSDNPAVMGTLYTEYDENGRPKNGMQWDYGFPTIPKPESNVFEEESLKKVDTFMKMVNKKEGGAPDFDMIQSFKGAFLLPYREWSRSDNYAQLTALSTRFLNELSSQAQEQLARDWWRDGLAGMQILAKWNEKDEKTGKMKTREEYKPIINLDMFGKLMTDYNQAKADGDPKKIQDTYNELEKFKSGSFQEYTISRMWGKIDPAMSFQTMSKTKIDVLGTIDSDGTTGGHTWYDPSDNIADAIQEGIVNGGTKFVEGIVDKQGNPRQAVEAPVVNKDPLFTKNYYKPTLDNLYQNKGITLWTTVDGKKQQMLSITDEEAKKLNNKLVSDFVKQYPDADLVGSYGNTPEEKKASGSKWNRLFDSYRSQYYTAFMYNHMQIDPATGKNPGKEMMIPGSTISKKTSMASGGGFPAQPVEVTKTTFINPTYEEAFGKIDPLALPTYVESPKGPVAEQVRENAFISGKILGDSDEIYLGGSYIKFFEGSVNDKEDLANKQGAKSPVVMYVQNHTPQFPTSDGNMHHGVETITVVDPERLKYMYTYYDGERVSLDDPTVQAAMGITTGPLDINNTYSKVGISLGSAGYKAGDNVARIPGWIPWDEYEMDRRYNTMDTDAKNRANETNKVQQEAMQQRYNEAHKKAEEYATK